MKKLLLLTKTLLAVALLCVGQNAWADDVTQTINIKGFTDTAQPNITLDTSNPISQSGTNALTVYKLTTDGFNHYDRIALSHKNTDGVQMRWMFRNGSNAYQYGLCGNWNGGGTANTSYNISILDLYEGDRVTFTYEIRAGKDAKPKFCTAGVVTSGTPATANTASATLESGTTYTIVGDGENPVNLDLFVTNDNLGIRTITIVTSHAAESVDGNPVISVTGANGGDRTISIASSKTNTGNNTVTYYTKDGNLPSSSSTLYSGAFTVTTSDIVDEKVTIKAITYKEGNTSIASEVSTLELTDVGTTLTLNAPTINLTGMTESAGIYNPTYSFTSNQTSIAGNPAATITYAFTGVPSTAGTSYTPTTTGTLTVTASADGYNSAQSEITVSKVGFVLTNTVNTVDLYGDYASCGNQEWPTDLDYELIPNVTFDPISNTQGCTYRTTHSPNVYNALYARNKAFTATCSGLTEDMIVLFGDYQNNILKPITSTDNSVTIGKDGTLKYYYLYVQPTYKQAITISDAEWKTLCSQYSLDFTGISGIKAYIVTGVETDGRTLSLTQVNKVPAGTGVLLSGAADTYNIPVINESAATDDVSGNKLVGVVANKVKDANSIYVLMADPKVGFYKNANAFTVGANTAYLPADFAGSARSAFFFGGDITAVDNVEAAAKAKEGKFVENGKLVIVKNGQKFNAAGAKLY